MPLIDSDFQPATLLLNGHMQTIYPALFRKIKVEDPERVSIHTQDGDFLEMDHYGAGEKKKALIISHGLEGHSRKPYVTGMARHFRANGWQDYAWNYRGCSGKINRTLW